MKLLDATRGATMALDAAVANRFGLDPGAPPITMHSNSGLG